MVKRKSKSAASGQDDIKQGDLVWVKYKGIDWPAKVSNIYPKKITYYYLPLDAAVIGQPFKTNNPKSVKLIQPEDKIPACPDSKLVGDLQRAFKQAKEILQNPNEPMGLDDTSGSSALNGSLQQDDDESQVSNQGSPSTKRKKEAKKELRSEHDLDEPEEETDTVNTDYINFNVGDVVIVASEIGTWPGKILEIYDDHTICKLFPLSEKNEPCRVVWENVQEFPVDELDDYMEDTRNNENLYIAFVDVKRYLAEGSAQATKETKTKAKDTVNVKQAGRKVGRKRRAGSEKESEDESDRETTTSLLLSITPMSSCMSATGRMTSRKGKVAGQREKSNDECFEVERILDMKTFRNNKRRFLVSWKGYGTDEDSWEPEEGLRGARRLIEAYLKENGDKSRPTTSKAVAEQPEESSDSSYEVERILDMKILRNKKRKFLVHWKDYDSDENTWEPEENLNDDDARNLIKAFLKERENNPQPEKSKPAPKPMPKRAPKRQSPQKELEKEDKNNAESDENKSQPNKSKASQESMAKQTSTKKGQEKKNDNDAESDDSENDPVPAKSKTRNGLPRKKSLMSYTKPKSDEDSCESVDMSDESDVIEPRKMKSKNGPNHKTPVVIINWRYADSAPEAAGGSELMQHVPLAEVKHEAFPEN